MNLQEQILRIKSMMGLLVESSSEEAWELVGQEEPTIRNLMNNKGYSYDEDSVEKLTRIIDNLPTIEVTYPQIKNFYNLENKKSDEGLMKKMYEISSTENPRKEYRDYMMRRDKSEKRQRGYDPIMNFDRIISGDYENPLVLYIDDSYYVIGGRTRLYASIAANLPIKIKIIQQSDL
jgi:hypothetical protein